MTIEVTCKVPGGRWRANAHHPGGTASYPDGHFTEKQLKQIAQDRFFAVRVFDDGAGKQPESLSVEDAISQAMSILTPACKDYGVDPSALEKDIRVVFAEAEEVGKPENADGGEEFQAVVAACSELMAEDPRDEEKFAGSKPKTKVLAEMVGFPVSGQFRDAAWGAAQGEE